MKRYISLAIGVGIILIALSARSKADYIVNGGFETGDFTGWNLIGDPTQTLVDTGFPHSGLFNAELGQTGSLASLSQSINTIVGTSYTLSFWFAGAGDTPSEFKALVGNNLLLDLVNPAFGNGYQQYSYNFVATSNSTLIQFQARDDVTYMQLDDVSVVTPSSIPEPTSMILFGIGMATLASYRLSRGRNQQNRLS
jgi:hypothetical protein